MNCGCSDPLCPGPHLDETGKCPAEATVDLIRVDFASTPRVKMCVVCSADALESGLFEEMLDFSIYNDAGERK